MGKPKNILRLKKASVKKREQRKFKHVLENIEVRSKNADNSSYYTLNDDTSANNNVSCDSQDFLGFISDDNYDENCNENEENYDEENDANYNPDLIFDLNLDDFLKVWSLKYFINRNALNILLKYINNRLDSKVPRDFRTLLNTPRNVPLNVVQPGNYVHIGLKKHIDAYLNKCQKIPTELQLRINIDGLPIYKDSSCVPAFWLIQGDFLSINMNPFIIGCYGGTSKPKIFNDFLKPTIDELKELNEYSFKGMAVKIILKNLLADAPAKSAILNTISHNGYYACPKCETQGKFIENKMCYFNLDAPLRTDISFRNKSNEEYHTGESAFENLEYFDMIDNVMIDYMHTVLLGVSKKIMRMWFIDSNAFKLSNFDKNEVSKKISKINETMPKEFQRKLRHLNYITHYKATEFRSFLLFYGPIVLKDILDPNLYDHFLKLHIAIRILCDKERHFSYNNIANILLDEFIQDMAEIYGEKEVVYNVHLLCHLARESLKNGCLDGFSCFPFENRMMFIKKLIKSSNNPLQQLHNRLAEYDSICSNEQFYDIIHDTKKISSSKKDKILFDNCLIDSSEKNRFLLLKTNQIFKFNYSFVENETKNLNGEIYINTEDLYDLPITSRSLDIYALKSLDTKEIIVKLEDLKRKMFSMNIEHVKDNDNKYDSTKWKQYDCILKFPSKYGDEGIKDLKTAKKKEAFYVNFSDTDEFDKTERIKNYYKQHPVSKFSEKSDLNHLIPNKAKNIKLETLNSNLEDSQVDKLNTERLRVQQENEILQACKSIVQTNNEPINNESLETSFDEYGIEISTDNQSYDVNDVPKVIAEVIPNDSNQILINMLQGLMPQISRIISQNDEILAEQYKIMSRLEAIEARLENLEVKYECDTDLDGFQINKIDSSSEFDNFLRNIQKDKVFRAKVVLYLFKNCPQGSANYYHYGVLKNVIKNIFTENFQDISGWGAQKKNKNDVNGTEKSIRVVLSEYTAFCALMVDILNNGSKKNYTTKDVGASLMEFFKRRVRMDGSGENS